MKKIILNEEDKEYCINYMRLIKINKPCSFEFKKIRQKRSLNQNSLLWLWMTALEVDSETGYTKDEFYELFITKFAPKKEVLNENINITTSKMDSKQMATFLDNIQRFALTELMFKLPDSEDIIFSTFYETYKNLI